MKPNPIVLTAACWVFLGGLGAALGAPPTPTGMVESLGPAVEARAAQSRPQHWPMKRACLYYALAGQALLAQQGIPAQLVVGRVVYAPGTSAAYAIRPHAWLETETHFIDFATLPRWGEATVVPRALMATEAAAVRSGVTQVLVAPAPLDRPLQRYLSHHARRFWNRSAPVAEHPLPAQRGSVAMPPGVPSSVASPSAIASSALSQATLPSAVAAARSARSGACWMPSPSR